MAFSGAMIGGSLGWGTVAQRVGVPEAPLICAIGMAFATPILHWARQPSGEVDMQASKSLAGTIRDGPPKQGSLAGRVAGRVPHWAGPTLGPAFRKLEPQRGTPEVMCPQVNPAN
jgi:hypothetical protein